jgi:hypothetical protein
MPDTGDKSLWFAFHTPHSGRVTLNFSSHVLWYSYVVYEGSVKGELKPVKVSGIFDSYLREFSFTSKPNTEYRIVVDSFHTPSQTFRVDYLLTPPNDFFADATPLSGDLFSVSGNNRAATEELFEVKKRHAGTGQGKTVWWKWTAPANMDFTINTVGSAFDTVLAVYTGETTESLTEVATSDDRNALDWTSQVTFAAVAGTTYHIVVDSFREDAAGDITLNGFRSGSLTIIRQPTNQSVQIGKRAVFDVSVLSSSDISYQWFFNDEAIPGQTSANLVIDPAQASNFGNYKVQTWSAENTVTSNSVTLSERQIAPKLTWSSGNQSVAASSPVTLSATFSGSTPITYTWTKNGLPIAGADSFLSFPSATTTNSGTYRLTATNTAGSAYTDLTLSVVASPWERWEWRRPGIPNAAITDIKVYGNDAFAISGNSLLRSTDGENWAKSYFPQGFLPRSLAKNGNTFVCLGRNSVNVATVAISTNNAVSWTLHTATGFSSIYQSELYTITSFGSYFLANLPNSQYGNAVLRSTNGIDWSIISATNLTGQPWELYSVGSFATDGATIMVASSSSAASKRIRYYKSNDGLTWIEYQTEAVGFGNNSFNPPQTAFYALGKFHLTDSVSIFSSTDGISWSAVNASQNGIVRSSHLATNGEWIFSFIEGSTQFNWFKDPAQRQSRSLLPSDSHRFSAAASYGNRILYGTDKGTLVAVSDANEISIPLDPIPSIASVRFADGIFIADSQISGDGVTWKKAPMLDTQPITMTGHALGQSWGFKQYQTAIYAGYNPFDVRANDQTNIGLDPNICFIGQLPNGNALAVTQDPFGTAQAKLLTRAPNASSWTLATFPGGVNSASKFTSISNRWISNHGIASASLIYSSADGKTWQSTFITGSNTHLVALPAKNWLIYQDQYYPYATRAAYSTNLNVANSWVPYVTTGIPTNNRGDFVKRVVGHEGRLILLGTDENLYYSENGEQWFPGTTPGKVVDIAAGNGQLIAIMKNGGIIQAGSVQPGGGAPVVSIHSPQSASTILVGSRITIEGSISDPEGGAINYDCYLDAELVTSGSGNEFRFDVTATDLRGHTVTVQARDAHGLRQMDSVRLRVVPPEPENLLASDEGKIYVPNSFSTTFDGVFYTTDTRNVYRSTDGIVWQLVPIPSFTGQILGIASGNGSLVIQFGGSFITTRDGVNWTHFLPNLVSYSPNIPVRFSSGVFIAGFNGVNSSGGIMTSIDGLRWKISEASDAGRLNWSANNPEGTIIGVRFTGNSSVAFRSIDGGSNWLSIAPLVNASWTNSHGIFADHKFLVAVTGGPNLLYTSQDGITWDSKNLPAAITSTPAMGHFGGLLFLGNSPNFSHVSQDGNSWQAMSHSVDRHKITYARGLFVAFSPTAGVVTSADGVTWLPVSGLPSNVSKILSNDSSYILIDNLGAVWKSFDGLSWVVGLPGKTATTTTITGTGQSIAQLGNSIVVAGGAILATSENNGRSWANTTVNNLPPSTSRVYNKVVASNSEMLVIEGPYNSPTGLLRSTDGKAFSTIIGAPAKTWRGIAWNGNEWMLIASDGSLYRSINGGLTWTIIPSSGIVKGVAIVWFNNRWIIIGAEQANTNLPIAFTLESGDILQKRGSIGISQLLSHANCTVAHGRLIVWANGVAPCITQNGIDWSSISGTTLGGGNNSYCLYYTPDGFTAFGGWSYSANPPRVWTSGPTGTNWKETPSPFTNMTLADNLGDRVFLFFTNKIAELYRNDLNLALPNLTPSVIGVGDTIGANVTITNLGGAIPVESKWSVEAWLSKSHFFGDGKSVPIGKFDLSTPMPVPGASASYPVTFTLPNELRTGDNYLILTLVSKDGIPESNKPNNTVFSKTAAITIPEWEFSVATNGNGQVNRDFAAMRYPHKSQVSLTASAGKGATFTGWGGDALGAESQITVFMDGNKSVSASFSNRATLQVFVNGAGSISDLSDGGSYPVGQTAAITAAPASGWVFSRWSGDSTTTQSTASILMDGSKTVTAHFVLPMATWKSMHFNATQLADANISGDNKDPDQDGVENWKEYLHGSNPMDRNAKGVSPVEIEAGFLRCVYTRNLGAAVGGSVTCQASRNLSNWNAPGLQERVLATINGIQTIEARLPVAGNSSGFLRFLYTAPQLSNRATLQVFLNGAGAISGLSDGGSYPVGQTAAITAAPAPGWVFSRWSGDFTTTQPTASILMDSSKTVTAHFVWPVATWKSTHFNATQLADANISGDNKDPDQDGVENWKEYLHGSNPMDRNAKGVSPVEMEAGFLRCVYTRNLGAAVGGSVTCQASRNLSNWNAPGLQERVLSTINGIQTIEARLPVAGNPSGFLRFLYTAPQP